MDPKNCEKRKKLTNVLTMGQKFIETIHKIRILFKDITHLKMTADTVFQNALCGNEKV